jgi:RimJ/RimL family protein N-acetyltransferase
MDTSSPHAQSDLTTEFESLEATAQESSTPDAANPGAKKAPLYERLWTWVPIRALAPRHRDRIAEHLLSLPPQDIYLRFGYAASAAQIRKYVDMLDFERDEVFGIFNRQLSLVAMAHLAYPPNTPNTHTTQGQGRMAEFGVSVLPGRRGRGYGSQLFDHAVLHARNRNMDALFIHALSENDAMLKIARRAGALVKRDANESDAWLKLPDDDLASHLEEALVDQAAELNYQFKAQAKGFQDLLDATLALTQSFSAGPNESNKPQSGNTEADRVEQRNSSQSTS